MRENFLYYLWKYRKFKTGSITTTSGEIIRINDFGIPNPNAGPDILNARLSIDSIEWAGNVEFHSKASHWIKHGHDCDPVYDSVILHVVWFYDTRVHNSNGKQIPTLELKSFVSPVVFKQYENFFVRPQRWINCEKQITAVSEDTISAWLRELYAIRIQRKSFEIGSLHYKLNQDWEATTFALLSKYLAGPVNADAFLSLASKVDFRFVLKLRSDINALEAFLFGQAGLLDVKSKDEYSKRLIDHYEFLASKFRLDNPNMIRMRFLRLRPDGFPTIRMSQLANLYHCRSHLFSRLIELNSSKELMEFFRVRASAYWSNHYTFGRPSVFKEKWISAHKQINLIMNVVLPLKTAFINFKGGRPCLKKIEKVAQCTMESNSIVSGFRKIGLRAGNALQSQALIELKTNFCDKNKCLDCKIGNEILSRNM